MDYLVPGDAGVVDFGGDGVEVVVVLDGDVVAAELPVIHVDRVV